MIVSSTGRGGPSISARHGEQTLDEAPLLLVGCGAPRDDEDIQVTSRPQPVESCGAVEVHADDVRPEDVAHQAQDLVELLPRRRRTGAQSGSQPSQYRVGLRWGTFAYAWSWSVVSSSTPAP
jgi:hypothetical protein